MKSNCSWGWPTSRAQWAPENFGRFPLNHLSASWYHLLDVSKMSAWQTRRQRCWPQGRDFRVGDDFVRNWGREDALLCPTYPECVKHRSRHLGWGSPQEPATMEWTIWRGFKVKRRPRVEGRDSEGPRWGKVPWKKSWLRILVGLYRTEENVQLR